MSNDRQRILLVGCGAMGGALLRSWQNSANGLHYDIDVIEPSNPQYLKGIEELPANYSPTVIVFAVKPQILQTIIEPYRIFCGQGCLFISIAAGMGLDFFHDKLGEEEYIVRTMPNLPVTVTQGMTALIARDHVTTMHRKMAEELFSVAGKVLWVQDEDLMDVVTALSGSGPAYFFRLVESLAEAGRKMGLSAEAAALLARQTAVGAGKMLEQLPDSATALRERVTSPGGTTAAGLAEMNREDSLDVLVERVLVATTNRARELNYSKNENKKMV